MKRNLTLLSLIFVLCSSRFIAQTYQGISLTGFTHDVIAEATPASHTTSSVTIDAAGYVLYSVLYTANTTTLGGLNATGVYTTTTRTYSLAPYVGKNALRIATNTSDSLTLTNPGSYSVLSLLGFSSGVDAITDLTVRFTDGSSAVYTSKTLYNWSSTQPAIIAGFGKTNRSTDAIYLTATEPKMFSLEIPIACANQSKTISRVVVKNNTNGATVFLFAGAGVGKSSFVANSTPSVCKGGSTGTAKVLGVDMYGPLSYTWNPSSQHTQTATNLAAGVYTVTVMDGNGCVYTSTTSVTEPAVAFSVTAVNSNSLTCGSVSNGTAGVTVTGGTSPYTYSWANTTFSTATISGLAGGTYTATIKDAIGCTLTATANVAQPNVVITVNTSTLLCGTTANATATVSSVTGATGPFTYTWMPSSQTGSVATNLGPNTYSVMVKDASNCTITQTVAIAAPDFNLTTTGTTCTLSTGSATVGAITGGSGAPYTYTWTPAGGNAATASGLAAGNYTVTVKDMANCAIVKTFAIASITPTLSVTTNSLLCGNLSNGSASVTVAGGAGGPYTYTWTSSPVQTTSTASNLPAGMYTVTVKGVSGCIATQSFSIDQPAISVATVSNSCKGLPSGSATVTAVGGVTPYYYTWDATGMPNFANGQIVTGLADATYTVNATDANNCVTSSVFTVAGPTLALNAVTSVTAATCSGINDGKAKIIVTGGLQPYTYYWNTNPPQYTATVTGLPSPNTFICSVTDYNNCLISKQVTVYPAPTNLLIYVTPSNTICPGTSAKLNITGLTGAGTYTWNTGAHTTTITVSPTATLTAYSFTGSTTAGCIVTGSTSITTSTNAAENCVVGINEKTAAASSFNLYPNPNNGQFVLSLGQAQENAILEVIDALGKLVLTQPVTGLETTVNTSSLQNGMYFVIVRNENKVLVRTKVIKQ